MNFEKKIIEGECTLKLRSLVDGLKVVNLDSWDLNILGVTKGGKTLKYELTDPSGMAAEIGHCLRIELKEEVEIYNFFEIKV